MHMNFLTALLSSVIVQTAPLEEIYSDAPVVTNVIATADMTTNDVRAISGDVTSNVVTKAYVDALNIDGLLTDDDKKKLGAIAINGSAQGNVPNASAAGNYSTAVGASASAAGNYSTAMGYAAFATNSAVAFGRGASASDAYTTAFGYQAAASGNSAMALGRGANSQAGGAVQIGLGTNTKANTLQFKDYTLLESNGKIPIERINIGTTSDTVAAGNTLSNAVNLANEYTDTKADFTVSNSVLVATIEATAPAPGNYAAVSNAAMNAASREALAAKQDKLPYPTNAIPQGAVSGLSAALAGKANDNAVVKLTGDQEIGGNKIFTGLVTILEEEPNYVWNKIHSNFFEIGGDGISPQYVILPSASGTLALESTVAAAATAATNYTDEAIGAAIAPANPVFSNAVLSVGLGIDTNTVAAINALVEAGEELPIGGAATVGGLLLALAAAVAALKRTKADASALRYAMPASVALTPSGDAATLVCGDRAVTNATIASGFATLNLTFPAEVSGYVRDFYLRITVAAGESAPAISVPQGVTIENAGGAVPEIADGEASAAATTLVWFSETAPGIFTAKSETVKAVV